MPPTRTIAEGHKFLAHRIRQIAAIGRMGRKTPPRLDGVPPEQSIREPIAINPVQTSPPEEPAAGALDWITADRIAGWAFDPHHPDTPVAIDVMVENNLFTQVIADQRREDLAEAGYGNGNHGFDIRLPFGELGSIPPIVVRRASDKRAIRAHELTTLGLFEFKTLDNNDGMAVLTHPNMDLLASPANDVGDVPAAVELGREALPTLSR
jgi:hypothetical protein